MIYLPLSVLSFLAGFMKVTAVRYGEYSVARMPQYGDEHEDTDVAPARAHDDYSDRSPDAPARLDYKYEEDFQRKSDDVPMREIDDETIWDKPIKKKRKHLISHRSSNRDIDKYTSDETDSEQILDKRFTMHRPNLRKRNFAKQSEPQRHMQYDSIDRSIDNVDNKSNYVPEEIVERVEDADTEEATRPNYESTTRRKPRRRPRDRAHHRPEWRESNKDVKLELGNEDVRSDRESILKKSSRRYDAIIHGQDISKTAKNNYDYDEYYDMKRVQNIKSRLPVLLGQPTVRTIVATSSSHSEQWLSRRARSPAGHTENPSSASNTTRESTIFTTTLKTTPENKFMIGNTSELSLAEKSRLSILKKAQRKENVRNITSSTKPPVLMQVTRKMQTMVMVEPRSPDSAMRARDALEDSPERLQRARRLMRHKLIAAATSIHELTDNWDQMICDYIDLSLLDTDAAPRLQINTYTCYSYITIILLPLLIYRQ